MQARREFLSHSMKVMGLLAGIGALPQAMAQAAWPQSAFEAKTMADLMKAMNAGSAPAESKEVTLTAPDIAENGAVVPLAAATTLAGVKRMMILVEKNPNVLSATFDGSDSVESNFATRVKMGQSSNVYAVAMMNDGKVLFAQKEVKVTLGGCGG
jgi:sulfur-oxidizing protein SoxY